MSGLCGVVLHETCAALSETKLDLLRKVHYERGARLLEQSWSNGKSAILNVQTGLLPYASRYHARSTEAAVHLFIEGEIHDHEDLLPLIDTPPAERRVPGEIMLALFLREGPTFISRVRGEFAIAVYEEGSRRLHLFTDSFGTKS